MLLTMLLAAMLVIGIVMYQFGYDGVGAVGGLIALFGGVALAFAVVAIIIAPVSIGGDIAEYQSLRASLDMARTNPAISSMELAAIQQNVMTFNVSLARRQFWAKNPWTKWFYSNRIFEMMPIR